MALNTFHMSLIISALGIMSFIFGVMAEYKKPAAGIPITGKSGVICRYPFNQSDMLGYISVGFLLASTAAGYISVLYPYKGKSVHPSVLFRNKNFSTSVKVALIISGLALVYLLFPTIRGKLNMSRNAHPNIGPHCPIAKTGTLGCGAFISLDSTLLWLVALMLAENARKEHFDEVDEIRVYPGTNEDSPIDRTILDIQNERFDLFYFSL